MAAQIFNTDKRVSVHVLPITISLGHSASFRALVFTGTMSYGKVFNLEGAEYANWGSSDDYIKEYICNKEGFIGRPVPEVDVDGNPIVYQAPEPVQDDNRSMHNEADIRKINDLETELNEQKLKLDKILGLLGKNNLI
jgi:hypothetical protein